MSFATLIIGFAVMMIGIGMGNWAHNQMLGEVNSRLSSTEKLSPYWWYWNKSQRLWKLSRAIVPQSRTRLISGIAMAVQFTGFAIVVWQFLMRASLIQGR